MTGKNISLREKVTRIKNLGWSERYLALLLEKDSMTEKDRAYVEKMYDIIFKWRGCKNHRRHSFGHLRV
jgi:hypothetical protein